MDYSAGGKCVHIVTQKNRAEDIIPISEEALDLIGYSPDKRGMVFKGLQRCWTQTYMKEWIRSAGITKNISFHSYRRTFATLQAAAGTDIRTIQSIMAHKKYYDHPAVYQGSGCQQTGSQQKNHLDAEEVTGGFRPGLTDKVRFLFENRTKKSDS